MRQLWVFKLPYNLISVLVCLKSTSTYNRYYITKIYSVEEMASKSNVRRLDAILDYNLRKVIATTAESLTTKMQLCIGN